MTISELLISLASKSSSKELTNGYNSLSVAERTEFLSYLTSAEKTKFIDTVRTQAVKDFWTHEQQLIINGECTRNWSPEQIEDILHISDKTGSMSINGEAAYDIAGVKYYGHHMKSVAEHPEYAGDWQNIQALDYNEHYNGAHGGNTKTPTDGFYDYTTGETIQIGPNEFNIGADVRNGDGYVPTQKCIFMSDNEIEKLYSEFKNLSDGEKLALKNFEYSLEQGGDLTFDQAMKVAEKYKCLNEFGKETSERLESLLSVGDENVAEYIAKNSDDILKVLGESSDDFGKAFIEHLTSKSDKELAEYLIKYSDDVLKFVEEDSISLGQYVLSEGGKVSETLADGSTVSVLETEIKTAEQALKEGYEVVEGSGGKVFKLSKGGVIKVLNVACGALIVYDAAKTFKGAFEEYAQGNYRTGSKELITYGCESLGALAVSELFVAGIAAVGVAAGVTICAPVIIFGAIAGGIIGLIWGEAIGDGLGDIICDLLGYEDAEYSTAAAARRFVSDPLVIDMLGNGFNITNVKDGVYFDEDALGLVEKTGWITEDDALLVLDINNDGIINDGSELFGTSTVMASGNKARNGFEALEQYDINGDGVIDDKDEIFDSLKVWQDKNHDGVSQQDEIYTLDELGVSGISLNTELDDGIRVAEVMYADGSTRKIGEFTFSSQLYNTIEKEKVDVSDDIKGLPDIQAIGRLNSLHTLMQTDETGTLKGYVEQFIESTDRNEKHNLIEKILQFACGAENISAGSRGGLVDARRMSVIEHVMGRDYVGTEGRNPVNTATPILNNMYTNICNTYYCMLDSQTGMKDYLSMTFWDVDSNGNKILNTDIFDAFVKACEMNGHDVSDIVGDMGYYIKTMNLNNAANFEVFCETYVDRIDDIKAIADVCGMNVLSGSEEANVINGSGQSDFIHGLDGSDTLRGGDGNDLIYGQEGNDTIYGENGNDTLVGGQGSDYIEGGSGADTYVHTRGEGNDTIYNLDYSSGRASDKLILKGVNSDEAEIKRSGNSLVITDTVSGEVITVSNAFNWGDGRAYLEKVEFDDGVVFGKTELAERSLVINGSEANDSLSGFGWSYNYSTHETFYAGDGNDTVSGNDGNDTIYGEAGNDTLYGGNGNDTIVGGSGNDYMEGGSDTDTYIHTRGDGSDTIYNLDYSAGRASDKLIFRGVNSDEAEIKRSGNSLIITDTVSGEVITVTNAFNWGDGRAYLEKVEFEDGVVFGKTELADRSLVINGSEANDSLSGYGWSYNYSTHETFYAGDGNDTVSGNDGNDTIYGEAGNDSLYGGNGNDTIVGGSGNDYMEGGSDADTYIHTRGEGSDTIYNLDYSAGRVSDKLILRGVNSDEVKIKRSGNSLIITDIVSGEVITVTNAFNWGDGRAYLEKVEFDDGVVFGKAELAERSLEINGTDENNTLSGFGWSYNYSTHETFYAGDGNDTVSGNDGNDTIYGEAGNDTLYGGNGNDTIVGGSGNDYMEGGSDADTYIHTRGDGSDTIYNLDYSAGRASDKLILRGVNSDEAEIKRSGNSLIITDTVSGEVITVTNAFNWGDGRAYLEKVEFEDGVVFGKTELAERSLVINGTDENNTLSGYGWSYNYSTHETFYAGDGNDTVSGNDGNDTIYGEAGNDSLYGGNGNDTIAGGSGNDYMEGGSDADTYIHTRGDGSDTIYNLDYSGGRVSDKLIMKGTNSTDVVIKRSGNSLIITDTVSGEVITVSNAFNWGDGRAYLEKVEFDDGVVFGKAELAERSLVINGSDANDSLSGFGWSYNYSTHETFYAGDGNDTVSGNDGNDTIYGESGNDALYGGNGNDTIVGGSGNDYMEGGSDADLYIHTRGDGSDTIYNLDYSAGRGSDKLILRGVNSDEAEIKRSGNSLIITDTVSGEVITVSNAFNWGDGRAYLEKVEFDDGVIFGKAELAERSLVINGSDANDSLSGFGWSYNYSTHETFYAGDGNDTVSGNDGNDTIFGEDGADKLYGGNGNDTIVGGSGNDYMEGGSDADTYIHFRGDGSDTIYNLDYSSGRVSDKLVLKGVNSTDVVIKRSGNSLVITDIVNGEIITVSNAFNWGDGRAYLEKVEFDDGVVFGKAELAERSLVINGSDANDSLSGFGWSYNYSTHETFYAGDGNDTVSGNDGNDTIFGEDGADKLYGGNGNDTIVGGSGNDYMEGGSDADTYVHTRGEGSDTIYNLDYSAGRVSDKLIMKGTNSTDVVIKRSGNSLVITDTVSGEVITVSNAFNWGDGRAYLEKVEFDDGVVFGKAELAERSLVINGSDANDSLSGFGWSYNYSTHETFYAGDGNDTVSGNDGDDTIYGENGNDSIYGGNGNDILVGGSGNDYLEGGSGADIYIHNRGDGSDTIYNIDYSASRTSDKLIMNGVKAEDAEVTRNGNHLVIKDTIGDETITIKDAYNWGDGRSQLNNVEFDDATAVVNYATASLTLEYKEIVPVIEEEVTEFDESVISSNDFETEIVVENIEDINSAVQTDSIVQEMINEVSLDNVSDSDITNMADLIVQEMSGSIISDNVSDELNLTEISEDTSYDQLWVS